MATLAAQRAMDRVSEKFPSVRFGVTNCRKIAGSSTWSQHSWSNAVDIHGSTAVLNEVHAYLNEHRGAFDIRVMLWWVKDHYDHIHIDFWPKGHNTPSCASGLPNQWKYSDGLVSGVYKLETEDDVPQFTEAEADQLKLFLELLENEESSVYFVGPAINLIRRERDNRLHSHEGEILVDKVARERIDDLLEKLRAI